MRALCEPKATVTVAGTRRRFKRSNAQGWLDRAEFCENVSSSQHTYSIKGLRKLMLRVSPMQSDRPSAFPYVTQDLRKSTVSAKLATLLHRSHY